MSDSPPILEIDGLKKYFQQDTSLLQSLLGNGRPPVKAVDDVTLSLGRNEVAGIIGESGCGKSTFLKTLMGLHDPTGGTFRYRGKDVSTFDRADWKEFRQNVQFIFQDPFNSIDPKMTVEEALKEPLQVHGYDDQDRRVREALSNAELNPVDQYLHRLPDQLSGGEKQRVSIARALVLEPEVILADEPVSMLDVSTQASVLNLLSDLTTDLGVSMFYISHDLSTVAYVCERVNVMYLGRIVEKAPTEELLSNPKHPYTEALLQAIPVPDPHEERERTQLDETVPDPINLGDGCRFKDRCPERMDVCDQKPYLVEDGGDHEVACHLYYDHQRYSEANRTGGDATSASQPVGATDGGD